MMQSSREKYSLIIIINGLVIVYLIEKWGDYLNECMVAL